MGEIAEAKAMLRQEMRRLAQGVTAAARAEASKQICDRIISDPEWQRAERVLFYSPLPDEPNISPLISQVVKQGKVAALPRFLTSAGAYEIAHIYDPDHQLQSGQFGILEPTADCPVCDMNELDFLLTPGLAFTERGQRLGRGKGFYDRLLAAAPPRKCGVCFDWQLVPDLPVESHDVQVERLVTPTRWITIGSEAGAND